MCDGYRDINRHIQWRQDPPATGSLECHGHFPHKPSQSQAPSIRTTKPYNALAMGSHWTFHPVAIHSQSVRTLKHCWCVYEAVCASQKWQMDFETHCVRCRDMADKPLLHLCVCQCLMFSPPRRAGTPSDTMISSRFLVKKGTS